nr:ParA family protein [Burkholderia ubonensis]
MAKRLVLFNHKGGVSKTTTVYNVGWMLAERGHRVLLVDADPQCNLSSLILGDDFDAYYLDDATRRDIRTSRTVSHQPSRASPRPYSPWSVSLRSANRECTCWPATRRSLNTTRH